MHDEHDRLVQVWKERAERDNEAHYYFLRSLKLRSERPIDAAARQVHREVFARIDCTRCANCCKTIKPLFRNDDIQRIAAHVGMSPEDFIAAYLEAEGDEYVPRDLPCPFLGPDDRCTIYEVRPTDCREYPHTDKRGFSHRTFGHSTNEQTCPAVYHIVRELQERLGGRRRR